MWFSIVMLVYQRVRYGNIDSTFHSTVRLPRSSMGTHVISRVSCRFPLRCRRFPAWSMDVGGSFRWLTEALAAQPRVLLGEARAHISVLEYPWDATKIIHKKVHIYSNQGLQFQMDPAQGSTFRLEEDRFWLAQNHIQLAICTIDIDIIDVKNIKN